MNIKDYKITNIENIESPALAVYPHIIKSNILKAVEIIGGNILRPHVKTCKTPEIVKMMMDQGIMQFKCATIAEAEMLGMIKVKDVLLAMQPVAINIERLKSIISAYPDTAFSCIIDNVRTLNVLKEKFTGRELDFYIDLNIGMNRTGIKPSNAPALIDECLKGSIVKLSGIHSYNGKNNDPDYKVREKNAIEGYRIADELRKYAELKAGRKMELVIGGSPDFMINAGMKNVQCSPGTFVFWDSDRARYSEMPFEVAAVLIARVVSVIDGNLLCLDLGYKAVASENPLPQRVKFLTDENAVPISQNEEHLVVSVSDTSKYRIGEEWYILPVHICPTVNLYNELAVIENGMLTNHWKVTARNRKINY